MVVWGGSAVAALALAVGLVSLLFSPPAWPAVPAGWLVAVVNAAAARAIHRKAVGATRQRFILWGIVGNSLRMVAVLCILLAVIFAHKAVRGTFIVSVFAGIFALLPAEIVELFRIQDEQQRTH